MTEVKMANNGYLTNLNRTLILKTNKQMTTDTAVRTTRLIIKDQKKFEDIAFIDYPEFRFNKNEATEMPFRYVLDAQNRPILPEGMLELIKRDSEQSLDDLL